MKDADLAPPPGLTQLLARSSSQPSAPRATEQNGSHRRAQRSHIDRPSRRRVAPRRTPPPRGRVPPQRRILKKRPESPGFRGALLPRPRPPRHGHVRLRLPRRR